MSDTDEEVDTDLFQEPDDFFKPAPEPTFATHTLLSGKELKLRLVGHNPLWVGKRIKFCFLSLPLFQNRSA